MKFQQIILPTFIVGSLTVATNLFADEAAETVKDLRKHIEELDQKVRILERKTELEKDAST